jgi:hypothetical protein
LGDHSSNADPDSRLATGAKMFQRHRKLALEHSDSGFSALQHLTETRPETIALPKSTSVSVPVFDPSHSHRIWRMMSALIDAVPEWADVGAFERDREKMLRFGLSRGMTLEQLYALSDPDAILGLWTAAEAKDVEL